MNTNRQGADVPHPRRRRYAFKTSFEHTNLSYGAVLAYVVAAIAIVFGLLLTRGGRSLRLS